MAIRTTQISGRAGVAPGFIPAIPGHGCRTLQRTVQAWISKLKDRNRRITINQRSLPTRFHELTGNRVPRDTVACFLHASFAI